MSTWQERIRLALWAKSKNLDLSLRAMENHR